MMGPLAYRRAIGTRHKWIRLYLSAWCDRAAYALRASAEKHW